MPSNPRAARSAMLAGLSAALAFAVLVLSAEATRAAPGTLNGFGRGLPRSAKPLPPVEGEVIVRFKADASIVRAHALGAQAKPEAATAVLTRRAEMLGARRGRALEAGHAVGERTQVVRQRGADAAELARHLAADPDVEFAEPNQRMRRLAAPNDPLYTSGPAVSLAQQTGGPVVGQWYLRKPDSTFRSSIDAEAAWARGFGLSSVVVAVLDTGVRFEHPDLGRVATGGKLLPGYDFIADSAVANDSDGRDADPSDPGDSTSGAENSNATGIFYKCDPDGTGVNEDTPSSWHGTSTASLVAAAANNSVGMAGTAPGVLVLPVRVLGKCFGRSSDIQAAMRWAGGLSVPLSAGETRPLVNPNPAKVINLSLGSTDTCSAGYQSAVDELVAAGVVIVAAAGNSAGEPVGAPANCNGVIAVSALRHIGTKVGFSDLGSQISISSPGGNCINTTAGQPCLYPILAALNAGLTGPGASIWSDSFDYTVGTSFAAPLVAGVAALLFSQNPSLTVAQVRTLLQSTARAFPTSGSGSDVVACKAPATGVQQLECYCPNPGAANYPLCGAGMLDAGAAVNAAALGLAVIDVSPSAPVGGQSFTLDAARSVAAPGRSITRWSWALVSGGGIVSAFSGATNAATATLAPSGAGTIDVRLTVTDSASATSSTTMSIAIAAPASDSKGGGSLSPLWLALLALAVAALHRVQRRARAQQTA